MAICLILGIASFSFTWSKCGAKTLILGNGGLAAAATGMCDK
jgi:shikimate 5-dehydrogenase